MNVDIEKIKTFTLQELQNNFYDIIDIVQSGEFIIITCEKGNFLMVPYKEVVDTYDTISST